MRSTASMLGASLVMAAAACSLTTSFDGLSTGTTPEATDSGASGSDDAADAWTGDDASDSDGDAGVVGYRETVMADAPLGYWRLGDVGNVAKDETGQNPGMYTGTVTHAKGALAGDGDGAAVFDGTSHVAIGDVFPFVATAPYTIEAWVAPAATTSSTACVLARNVTGDSGSAADGYALYIGASPATRVTSSRYRDSQESGVSGGELRYDTFAHVVATFDGTSLAIWVDGERVGQASTETALQSFAGKLTIGASRGGAQCYFRGSLDEVALYGVALSPDRIRAHHAAGTRK